MYEKKKKNDIQRKQKNDHIWKINKKENIHFSLKKDKILTNTWLSHYFSLI